MKVGLASFAFRWAFKAGMPVEDFLKKAAGFHAEVVQLCENSGIDRLDDQGLNELSRRAEHLGLTLEYGDSSGNAAQMEQGIHRTACLNAHIYRCVLDSGRLAPSTIVANLRKVLPALRSNGVTLCVENHFRLSPNTLRRIVSEVDDAAIRVCLDPLNSIAQLTGPEESIRELLPFARTAHVKDARITRSGTGWVITGTPLGEGDLDLASYLRAVAPQVESVLLESWMDPVDGEQGPGTLEQESLWAKNGVALIRELASATCNLAAIRETTKRSSK